MMISAAPASRASVSGNSRASFSAGMITEIFIVARSRFRRTPRDPFRLRKTLRAQRSPKMHLGDLRQFSRAVFLEELLGDCINFLARALRKLHSIALPKLM